MRKKLLMLSLWIFTVSTSLYAYQNKNAILLVNKNLQHDSLGYNFVTSFLKWAYYNIEKGHVRLYDSPLKINEVGFLSLQSMEDNSKTSFKDAENLFINEIWSSNNTSSSFIIRGLTITAELANQEEISFGFISYAEIVDLLKIGRVIPGVDASYSTSFFEILMNKRYNFDLIYFDDMPVINPNSKNPEKDYQKASQIKFRAFNSKKKSLNAVKITQLKKITYSVRKSDYDPTVVEILKSFENYFDAHKRYILYLGGENLYNFFKFTRCIITECHVTELLLMENGQAKSQLVNIQPYSFNLSYFPMERLILDTLDIFINDQSLEEKLQKKDYTFHLLEINDVKVDELLTQNYMDALMRGDWSKLSAIKRPL